MHTVSSGMSGGWIPPHAVPGLSTCLEEGRLTLDGRRLLLSPLELDAVRVVEWAAARHVSVVLVPADPLAPLAALIPAAVHVAKLTESYRRLGTAVGSSLRAGVVTGDYHVKGLYRSLGVRSGRGGGSAPLRAAVPAATLGQGGSIHVLDGARHGGMWSTIFVRTASELRDVGPLDLVVADLPVADFDALAGIDAACLVVVGRDPADPVVAHLAGQMPVFAWSEDDLRRCDRDGLPPRLVRRLIGRPCEVLTVDQPGVCENAGLFWDDIGPLVQAGRRATVARQLALEALGLFYDLLGLALPAATYERLVGVPLAARVRAVGQAARVTVGELRDLYVPMVEAVLRGLVEALGPDPAKRAVLHRVIARHLDDGSDTLLIARTAALARAYEMDLDRVGLGRARVTSLGALAGADTADVGILLSVTPAWGRWVYRSGVAERMQILTYRSPSANRFSEADIVRRVVDLQATRMAAWSSPDSKETAWRRLCGEPPYMGEGSEPPAPQAAVLVEAPQPPDVPPGLWIGVWRHAATIAPPSGPEAPEAALGVVASAMDVQFSDGTHCLLDAAARVTRWRPTAGEPELVAVTDLRVGDQLVLLDGDAQKDLVAKILEVAEGVPELAAAAPWISRWRSSLARAWTFMGSYAGLAEALRRGGCRLQDQSVRLWVVGKTLGPEDPQDVRRLGELVGDPVLVDFYRDVHEAVRTLRGTSVRLHRRLAVTARRVGPAHQAGRIEDDEVIDERSGLTAADFHDAVAVVTVSAIRPAGSIPRLLVGRRLPPEENRS